MIRLLLLGAVLSWAAPAFALNAGDGISLASGTVATSSSSTNFLATSASLSCSSSAGKLIVDSTADTLSYCSSGGSTVKYAAIGNDSGDATGIADGTIVNADVNASAAIALSKLANMSTDRLLGRDTASTGAIEEITVGGGVEFSGSTGIQRSALTGDVTASAGSNTTAIASGVIVNADVNASAGILFSKLATTNTDRLLGRDTAGGGAVEELTVGGGVEFTGTGIQRSALTGDVTASAGSGTTAIGAGVIIDADVNASAAIASSKLAAAATDRILGRDTAGAGAVEELTVGGGLEFTGSGGLQRSALTGDVTASAGSGTTTIGADAVALGTDTTGNYVATVAGTSNEVSVSGSGSETAAVTVSLPSTIDLGGKTSFEVPNGASPTTSAFGQIAGDNDAWAASRGAPQWFDGSDDTYLVGTLASDMPTNGQVPKWNTGGTITWEDEAGGSSSHAITASTLGLSCDLSTNDTATLRTALETGGDAAGATLFIPSGCKILLGTVGADPIDLASNTTIRCEDQTAGFALARRMCTGGTLNNVACDSDAQCQGGGTCSAYDGDAVSSFAPTSGTTYTLFRTAADTTGQGIIGCSIWANQTQGDSLAMGGDGIETGYCSGGTSDGDTCFQTCDTGDATWAGYACNASGATDCGGGSGSCQNRSQCATGGGTCVSIPYNISRGASGAGSINPIDFSNSTSARVENVKIWDHRKGDFAISSGLGPSSLVANSDTTAISTSTESATGFGLTSYDANRFVTYGIKVNSNARARGNVTAGWDAGMLLDTEVIASGNTSNGLPGAVTSNLLSSYDHTGGLAYSGWKGSVGFMVSGVTTLVEGNRSSAFVCAAGENGGQHNWWFRDNTCEDNHGPKVIANGSGIEIETNRFAWNTRDTIIALGDVRGRCSGGTRSGLVCLRNMGTNATYGCPSSTCAYSSDFKWGASNVQIDHVNIVGNFLHSDQNDVDYIGVAPGKRCQSGADAGKECSSTADCDSTAPCEYPYVKDLNVVGNNLYGATTGDTAVDFSAVTAVRSSGTTTPLLNINIAANRMQGFPTGVSFASASGLGAFINIEGAFQNVTTPLVNWRDEYGSVAGIQGLLPTDDQPVGPITLTAGESISRGHLVSASTSADNTVVKTTTGNPERAFGVALHDASSGNIKIVTAGVGPCIADESIANGAALMPSGSTSGRVKTWTTGNVIVGRALDNPGSAGTVFDCLIGGVPPVQGSSAVFPKIATPVKAGSSTSFIQACSASVQAISLSHTATSGRAIIVHGVVNANNTGASGRQAIVEVQRGGTNCDTGSPTTLGTFKQYVSAADDVGSVPFMIADSGQSGSVTYRVCLCTDTASGTMTTDTDSIVGLTEY